MLPALVLSAVFLSGCVSAPQKPVSLQQDFWEKSEKIIGVVMTKVPELDVYLPGAGCLLCIAVAEANHTKLSKHVDTLQPEGVANLKAKLIEILTNKEISAVALNEELDLEKLPEYKSKSNPDAAKYDFSKFQKEHNLTHLLVVDVRRLGIHRPYSSYVPTGDPKGHFSAVGYLVNLSDNTYAWYRPVEIYEGVTDVWDEPPKYPALTNSYYQALEAGKDSVLAAFSK